MTSEEMDAEIERLRLQQADQRKHWRCWGFASNGVAIALCLAVLVRAAVTGSDPPSPMIFIVLTYIYLGFAFTAAGRSHRFPWFPQR